MRRKEQEITDRDEIDAIIRKALVMHIAMADGDVPYLLPLNFGYDGSFIYFHSASEGRKIDMIKNNPRVAFCFEGDVAISPQKTACKWETAYRSVVGLGKAESIESPKEKETAFKIIMNHYGEENPVFSRETILKTTILKIAIEEISGKKSL
jgi:uncharacterized protein